MPTDNEMPEFVQAEVRISRAWVKTDQDRAVVWLADALDRERTDNAILRQCAMDRENAEASVCPEDVGFVEYIGSLKSALDKAQRERDEAQQQNAHYRRMLALDVVTDPLSSRASLPSPETKL